MITINSLTKLRMAFLLTLLILIGSTMEGMGQTIPATNTVTVGINKRPTGWIAINSTTDVANTTGFGGSSLYPWVGSVSNPPNGHTTWVSGVGNSTNHESTGTKIENLTVGFTYEFTFHAAEIRVSPETSTIDGVLALQNGSGVNLQTYPFTGGASNAWTTHKFVFTATDTFLDIGFRYDETLASGSITWNVSLSSDAVKVICVAGTTAPLLSATSINSTCPATTVDLSTITASNTPANTELTWHTGTPATTANKIATADLVNRPAGTYFAAFFDATNNCYSGTNGNGAATTSVTATLDPDCIQVGTPSTLETPAGTTILGKLPIITGGIGAFTYSTVTTSDTGCVAPSGFTAFTGTINNLNAATGEHTITAPSSPGNYFYCIKVCGSDGKCTVSIHKVIVTEVCPAGSTAPTFN